MELANEEATKMFHGLVLKENVKRLYREILADVFAGDDTSHIKHMEHLEADLQSLDKRIESIEDQLADQKISPDQFHSIMNRYKVKKEDLEAELQAGKHVKNSFETYLKYGISLLWNIGEYFEKAHPTTKSKIVGSIFPENLVFDEPKYRTTRMNELVSNSQ